MLIDISRTNTIPEDIKKIIFEFFNNMPQNAIAQIKSNKIRHEGDVRVAIEDYVSPFSSSAFHLYDKLKDILGDHELICYHSTRLMDKCSILENGLKTNSWESYSIIIRNTYLQLGVGQSEIDEALAIIHQEYRRKYLGNERNSQLCFFSGMTLLQEDHSAGYEQFCENIGGELSRWA